MVSHLSTCIGVDVGGARKGFHAVALHPDQSVEQFHSATDREVAAWCRTTSARLIAIDAPCRWRRPGEGVRAAELALVRSGIRCFWTPTRRAAASHPTGFFDWMLAGERLYRALAASHPLLGHQAQPSTCACFETYPHAATCRLAGRPLDVRRKRSDRLGVLAAAGIDGKGLRSQDAIDAAICAMVARAAAVGPVEALGDVADGLIHLPPRLPQPRASPMLAPS